MKGNKKKKLIGYSWVFFSVCRIKQYPYIQIQETEDENATKTQQSFIYVNQINTGQ